VDLNKSAIRAATNRALPGRRFMVGDVKDALTHIGQNTFHIISGFEFLEHLEDPVTTLKNYLPFCSDYFIAGSPLCEPQEWLPHPEHLWTFDRRGYEDVFRAAGLNLGFSNEAYIGSHNTGFDWVTVIGGVGKRFPSWIRRDKHAFNL